MYRILRHNYISVQKVETLEEVKKLLLSERNNCLELLKNKKYDRIEEDEDCVLVGYIDGEDVWIENFFDNIKNVEDYQNKNPDCYMEVIDLKEIGII